jgi:hypothetical protein
MDDVHESISSIRRDLRRLEDEAALVARKKASNDDVEVIANKQAAMETETRGRLQNLQSKVDSIDEFMRRIATGVEAISDDLTKHKRKTANEFEELVTTPAKAESRKGDKSKDDMPRPFLPMQLQITLYILAGVGLMALIQNAPAAITTIPRLSFGG